MGFDTSFLVTDGNQPVEVGKGEQYVGRHPLTGASDPMVDLGANPILPDSCFGCRMFFRISWQNAWSHFFGVNEILVLTALDSPREDVEVLAGAVETPTVQGGRNPSSLYLHWIPYPGGSNFLGTRSRTVRYFRHSGSFGKTRAPLRHPHGLRCDHRLPLHGDCRSAPARL